MVCSPQGEANTCPDSLGSEEGSGFSKPKWNVLGVAGAEAYLAHVVPSGYSRQTDLGRKGGAGGVWVRSRPDDLGLSFVFVPGSL